MKLLFASFLLATTCCTSVFAAEFSPASKIDAVTVFPQGADVVRVLEVDVPVGEHSLILADLPQNIDAQSLRVEGVGDGSLIIGSVDTRNRISDITAIDAQRTPLENEFKDLQVERQGLDQTIADLNQQRTMLISLADKQLVPQSSTENVKSIDTTQLGGLLDLVGQRLAGLSKDIMTAQKRQRDIDVRIEVINGKLSELPTPEDSRTEVVVNVEATEAIKATLRVSYRVQEAAWVPFYDARLAIGDAAAKPKLELVHRAEVTQNTGESWNDVMLTLSTARPQGQTSAPEMASIEVSKLEAPEPVAAAAPAPTTDAEVAYIAEDDSGGAARTLKAMKLDKPRLRNLVQKQAAIETAGFQANYVIASRVTVDNAGQSKKVRITSGAYDAALQALTVPRVDTTVYLTASFTVVGQGPQLPGTVNLYRDGVYVGQGYLPLLSPSEKADLGFGADDLVKVTRDEVKRVSGEEGLLTSSNIDDRAWDITVKNLHNIAMPVRVIDRVPFTASKEIEISETAGMTAPTVRDLDKQRGVLAWDFVLDPQKDNSLKTGYKITWPEGMRVSTVD
jgi:uncharacterized protein (TIGR02231 family)